MVGLTSFVPRAITASGGTMNVGIGGTTWTLSSSLTTSGGGGGGFTKTGPGALAISGTQSHAAGATINVADGTLALNSAAGTDAATRRLNVYVAGATSHLAINTTQHLNDLNVSGGGLAQLSGGGATVLATNSLAVGGAGSRFDLLDNKAIVFGGNVGTCVGGTYGGLTGMIQSAYDFSGWDGDGITTSASAATTGITTIAIATADETPFADGLFGGVTVHSGDALMMYTYAGDANLDGTIDGGDYGVIDNFIQVPGAFGYASGDFNFDGIIDGGDYGVIDNNIQAQGAAFPTGAAVAHSMTDVTAVPEPSACGFAIAIASALLRRRRRRRPD
jgi:hypothetical protein